MSAALASIAVLGSPVSAQTDWPSRPIRLVVPYTAGGGVDVTARIVAAKMKERLKQEVVVDNRPGANTLIAANVVLNAAPDGYTLLWTLDQTFVLNPSLYSRLPYNPQKDFTPIALAWTGPVVVIARSDGGPASLPELVQRAKASADGLNIGSVAIVSQMALEEFTRIAGIKAQRIIYKGGGEAAQATLAGDVHAAFDGAAPYMPFVHAGRARMLAVTAAKRVASMPDVPTLDELGYKGLDFAVWCALAGPAGVPAPIVQRLAQEVAWALQQPDVIGKLASFGLEPAAQTSSAALAARIDTDIVRYAPIIKKLGFKLD